MASSLLLPPLMARPRLADADDRLRALLLTRLPAVFAWGCNDCAIFAADAVLAQLGADPAQPLRGMYSSARRAAELLRNARGLQQLVVDVLGPPLPAPLLARFGDVGLMAGGALAVCTGEQWALPTRHGLGQLPLHDAQVAWRVGHA